MNKLIIVLCLFCTSCFDGPKQIGINANIEYGKQDIIIASIQEWCTVSEVACIPVFIVQDSNAVDIYVDISNDTTCIEPNVLGYTDLDDAFHPGIHICDKVQQDEFRTVVLHELGHAITGKKHHLPPGNIMSESAVLQGKVLTSLDEYYMEM